jgi:hypothetical protein
MAPGENNPRPALGTGAGDPNAPKLARDGERPGRAADPRPPLPPTVLAPAMDCARKRAGTAEAGVSGTAPGSEGESRDGRGRAGALWASELLKNDGDKSTDEGNSGGVLLLAGEDERLRRWLTPDAPTEARRECDGGDKNPARAGEAAAMVMGVDAVVLIWCRST